MYNKYACPPIEHNRWENPFVSYNLTSWEQYYSYGMLNTLISAMSFLN